MTSDGEEMLAMIDPRVRGWMASAAWWIEETRMLLEKGDTAKALRALVRARAALPPDEMLGPDR